MNGKEYETPAQKRKCLKKYLTLCVKTGGQYFKSKTIAEELGMSSKEVGVNLTKLAKETDDIHIEKHARSTSTTWRVELPN